MSVVLITLFAVPAFADLKCSGTEPFWSLVIKSKTAIYENMAEGLKAELTVSAQKEAKGLKPGNVRKFSLVGEGMSGDAVVQKQKCTDGMSDITYPYNITLSMGEEVFSGCCK